MNNIAILNNPDEIQLAEKRFKKQLIRFGEWAYPNAQGKFQMTKEKAEKVVQNFSEKVRESLPLTLGHVGSVNDLDRNPDLYAGEIESLEMDDKGINGVIKVVKDDVVGMLGDMYKTVSIALDENYTDAESGEVKGPTLLHVALTSEGHVKHMDPFVALSEKYSKPVISINLSENEMAEEKKADAVEAEKQEQQVDNSTEVESSETATESTEDTSPEVVDGAESGTESTDVDQEKDGSVEDDTEAATEDNADVTLSEVDKLSQKVKELEAQLNAEKAEKLDQEINVMLSEGRITPAQKEAASAILSSDSVVMLSEGSESVAEAFRKFVKSNPNPVVDLSEKGVDTKGDTVKLSEDEKAAFNWLKIEPEKVDKYLSEKQRASRKGNY